jgi:hypothetical protein
MSGEDAPRPYLENLIVLAIKTNKQTNKPEPNARQFAATFDQSGHVNISEFIRKVATVQPMN